MLELIALIVLICSFLGILLILIQKIPILVTLPERKQKNSIFFGVKEKAKEIRPFKSFSFEIFLQKFLLRIKILTLKTENKTSKWLQKLRERSKKNDKAEDNYWQEIKKSIRK